MRTPIQCKRLRCVELHSHSPICLFGAKTERNLSALRKELISVALLGLVCRRYWSGVRIVDLKHLQCTDLCCALFTEQKHVTYVIRSEGREQAQDENIYQKST